MVCILLYCGGVLFQKKYVYMFGIIIQTKLYSYSTRTYINISTYSENIIDDDYANVYSWYHLIQRDIIHNIVGTYQ